MDKRVFECVESHRNHLDVFFTKLSLSHKVTSACACENQKQDAAALQLYVMELYVYLLKPSGHLGADESRPTSASCT